MSKRGMSEVVIVVLMIIISIFAVLIFWMILRNFLNNSEEGINLDLSMLDLEVEKANFSNLISSTSLVKTGEISVKLKSGAFNLSSIKFTFEKKLEYGSASLTYSIKENLPGELETRPFYFPFFEFDKLSGYQDNTLQDLSNLNLSYNLRGYSLYKDFLNERDKVPMPSCNDFNFWCGGFDYDFNSKLDTKDEYEVISMIVGKNLFDKVIITPSVYTEFGEAAGESRVYNLPQSLELFELNSTDLRLDIAKVNFYGTLVPDPADPSNLDKYTNKSVMNITVARNNGDNTLAAVVMTIHDNEDIPNELMLPANYSFLPEKANSLDYSRDLTVSLIGDLDNNGVVNLTDILVLRDSCDNAFTNGLPVVPGSCGDISGDGKVDVVDILWMVGSLNNKQEYSKVSVVPLIKPKYGRMFLGEKVSYSLA